MSIAYPKELIDKLRELEKSVPNHFGDEIANAMVYDKWNHRPSFRGVFFQEPDFKLIELLNYTDLRYPTFNRGLEPDDAGFQETVFDSREVSWSRIMSVYGSHWTAQSSKITTYLDYVIQPLLKIMHIDIRKMMGEINTDLTRTYLFTLGGEIIQDNLFDYESPWDYRGDILGLQTWQLYKDFSMPMSSVIEEAYNLRNKVDEENFRKHPYYTSAVENCKPKGVELIRKLKILKNFYDLIISGVKLERKTRHFE